MMGTKHRLTRALAGVGLAALLAACGGAGGGAGSHRYTIAFVPKLIGIPYFTAMQKGGQEAAKDLGVDFIYQGPTTADSAKQIETIDALISRHVDAIAVAPDDPSAVGPILEKAKNAGIAVLTSDTDAPNTVREVWVNQATDTAIGNAITDSLAKLMGQSGEWAIDSCGPTAQNLNSWIAVEKQRAATQYPGMKLVDVKYGGEDQAANTAISKDLITANPSLKGLVGECTTSAPAVGEAITQLGKIGQVFGVGLGTPTTMAPYIKNGSVPYVVLWNPVNLGYLTVWAAKQLLDKKPFQAQNQVGGPVGTVKYLPAQKMLLLGPPLVFDKSNIDQYVGKF
jgi:rhamnose transport system substrate-binding protein